MNKSQSNKLNMFEAVEALFIRSLPIISTVPILVEIKDELTTIIGKIKAAGKTTKTSSAGNWDAKDLARNKVTLLLLQLANSIYSYAKRKALQDVMAICNVGKSALDKMKENEFELKAESVIDKLKVYKAELAKYTVTDEKIAALETALTEFKNCKGVSSTGSATKSAAHDDLDALFDEGTDLLEDEVDGLIENFRDTNADFYNAYFAARVIKDLGGAHSSEEPAEVKTDAAPVK